MDTKGSYRKVSVLYYIGWQLSSLSDKVKEFNSYFQSVTALHNINHWTITQNYWCMYELSAVEEINSLHISFAAGPGIEKHQEWRVYLWLGWAWASPTTSELNCDFSYYSPRYEIKSGNREELINHTSTCTWRITRPEEGLNLKSECSVMVHLPQE